MRVGRLPLLGGSAPRPGLDYPARLPPLTRRRVTPLALPLSNHRFE